MYGNDYKKNRVLLVKEDGSVLHMGQIQLNIFGSSDQTIHRAIQNRIYQVLDFTN